MMVLNHFKSDTPQKRNSHIERRPLLALEPSMIQELIDDVNQHQLRKVSQKTEDSLTDELGFYHTKPRHSSQNPGSSKAEESSTDQVVIRAADMKKKSDDILANIQMVERVLRYGLGLPK